MKTKLRFICLLCVFCMLCGGCRAETRYEKYAGTFYDAFDTAITVIGYAEDQAVFDAAFNGAKDLFMHYHRIYDGYNAYEGVHNLYYVNRHAAEGPAEAEPELIDLLLYMKDLQPRLLGRVNVALGAVLRCWHEYREEGVALPDRQQLAELAEHVNFDDVIIDTDAGTVYFADPGLSLDLGAVAKGYATEIVASWLLTSGMTSYIISAGGNVRCGMKPLDGRARWGVGIQDPELALLSNNAIKDVVYLTDTSVVTSGDYQRYYTVDGVRYHHIIDPDTLYPSSYMRSVTVVTKDSGYADALSTMLFLLPYEEGRAFVDSQPEIEAYWILNDGSVRFTDGIGPFLRSQGGTSVD